jgi:methylthioribose-1-phosphate isomerase
MKTTPDIEMPQIPRGALGALPPTLEWVGGRDGLLRLLDQTVLPTHVAFRDCTTVEQVWEAIRSLRVRGAPAIGVAAAYGLCLGTRPFRHLPPAAFQTKVREVGQYLCSSRPTAVNLAWAIQRLTALIAARATDAAQTAWDTLLREAHTVAREDAETCRQIGEVGADLIPDGGGVLTHCNAGALATVAYGTALSLLYVAHARGRRFKVYADETRPLLQGARLTAFELAAAGIDVTVLCDGAAASLMQAGRVQLAVVGADRIAANGDTANKIGTYGVALAARQHRLPFYVAAPLSTFDRTIASGAEIPIEQRPAEEVQSGFGTPTAPPGTACYNPAFDVTPASLITGIVTEKGIVKPVTKAEIERVFGLAR